MKPSLTDLYDPKFGQSASHVMSANFGHTAAPHTYQQPTSPVSRPDNVGSYGSNGAGVPNAFGNGFIESPSTHTPAARHGNLPGGKPMAYSEWSDPSRNQTFTSYPGSVIPPPAHARFPAGYAPWEGGQSVGTGQQFGPGYGVQGIYTT